MSAPPPSREAPLPAGWLVAAVGLGLFVWVNAFGMHLLPFWPAMLLADLAVIALAVGSQGVPADWRRWQPADLPLAVAHALALYALFWLGEWLISQVAPTTDALGALYDLVAAGTARRAILFVALTVVAEELFWRGFLQRQLTLRLGAPRAILAATALYTVAHVGQGSPLLLLATIAAGLAWGGLYAWRGALLPALLSHLLFDALALFIVPFT